MEITESWRRNFGNALFLGNDEISTSSLSQILKLLAEKKDMYGFEFKFDFGKQKEKILHLV